MTRYGTYSSVEEVSGRIVKILRKNHGGFSVPSECHVLEFLMAQGVMGRVARRRDIETVRQALELAVMQAVVLRSPDRSAIGLPPSDPPQIKHDSRVVQHEPAPREFSWTMFRGNPPNWLARELANH
jgi:hypothetical protein